jgi:hypothetical protein
MANAPAELDDIRDDLARGLKLIADAAPRYERARAMYDGTAGEVAASPVLRKLIEQSAGAHPLSFAHIPVDALVDRVNLAGLSAEDSGAAGRLAVLYDELSLADEVDDWHLKAAYFGDYYAIVDPLDETEGGVASALRVAGSSPLTTTLVYSSKDASEALYGVKRWPMGEGAARRWHAVLYYDDASILLVTAPGTAEGDKAEAYGPQLDESGEPGSERVAHGGGRKLLVHYAIDGKPYGMPVHSKAYGPQEAITKISAVNLAAVDAQGFPSRYALADPLAEIDDDIDDDFGTDGAGTAAADQDGLTKATTGSSRLRDAPGTIKLLRGIKSVGQFDEASPDGMLKNLEFYIRSMAVATGTPLFEFDLGGEQPSGESRRRASARINNKARKVQRTLGRSHVELADLMLAVLGVDPVTARVSVTWLPSETETDAEGIALVSAKISAGVPVAEALLEAGYTAEQVAAWYPAGEIHTTPGLVATLAEALQKLGQALTLGSVTESEIAAMLPGVLTDARGEGAQGAPDDDLDEPAEL